MSPGCVGCQPVSSRVSVLETGPADLSQIVRESLDELRAVTAGQ